MYNFQETPTVTHIYFGSLALVEDLQWLSLQRLLLLNIIHVYGTIWPLTYWISTVHLPHLWIISSFKFAVLTSGRMWLHYRTTSADFITLTSRVSICWTFLYSHHQLAGKLQTSGKIIVRKTLNSITFFRDYFSVTYCQQQTDSLEEITQISIWSLSLNCLICRNCVFIVYI